jgi:protein ATS1
VWGCGDGRKGQLSLEYRQHESITVFQKLNLNGVFYQPGLKGYTIKSIAATWETSYLVLEKPESSDIIVSFGSNEFGDLGIARDAEDRTLEKGPGLHVVDFSTVSVAGNTIKSAKGVTVERLRTGQRHVIASLKISWGDKEPTQVLIGWGSCRHGQLGDMENATKSSSRSHSSKKTPKAKKSIQPTYCSRPTLVWTSNDPSDFIVDYSLGIHHSVFLHASGRISVKGSNRKKQIQGLNSLENIREVKCTWNGTYMLTVDDPPRILSTGSNTHGQLGRAEDSSALEVEGAPITGRTVKALACGSEHTLICLAGDGMGDEVWGWGWNEHGNLGIGNTDDSPTPQKIWPPASGPDNLGIHHIRSIWCGNGSSWILCEVPDSGVGSSHDN